jgi:ABC-type multidrug transport system fused ATPase/permease subunit
MLSKEHQEGAAVNKLTDATDADTDAVLACTNDTKSSGINRWTTFKRLFAFCRPQHFRIFAGLTSLTLNSVTNLYFPWMMGQVLDDASSVSAIDGLWNFLGASIGVIAVGSLASWVRVFCLQSSGQMTISAMKQQLFASYIEKDIHYFDESGIGEMVTVMEKDVERAAGVITENLPAGLRSFNSAVNGSVLLFRTSPQLCGIALSMTPVFGVIAMYIRRQTKHLTTKLRELQSESLNFVTEKFSNVSTIRLNCQELSENERYSKYTTDCYAISSTSYLSEGAFMGFLNMSTNLSLFVILFAGGRMINKGQLTAGSLTRFAMQSLFVGLGFSGLSAFYSDLGVSLDAAARYVICSIYYIILLFTIILNYFYNQLLVYLFYLTIYIFSCY